jgi:ABC-2 type transport system permease protein
MGSYHLSKVVSLVNNPVATKELRGRMRGRRAFVVLTVYLLLLSLFISLVYLVWVAAAGQPNSGAGRQAGKAVFYALLVVEGFLVVLIGPAFTVGAISGEKERQTYDLLRTTALRPGALVSGKLVSALSYVLLLVVAAVPLQSIALMLGGVSALELLVSQLLILVAAVAYAMVGLYFSAVSRSTLAASMLSLTSIMGVTFIIPLGILMIASFMGPLFLAVSSPNWVLSTLLIYGGLLLAATNLPATLITSLLLLTQENALFYTIQTIDSHPVPIFSPWYVFIFLYSMLTLLLYWACVRRVRRVADR